MKQRMDHRKAQICPPIQNVRACSHMADITASASVKVHKPIPTIVTALKAQTIEGPPTAADVRECLQRMVARTHHR